jgi:hypothetical protein
MTDEADQVAWIAAPRDYAVGLQDGKLVCRNPKGKLLTAVPSWLKDEEVADRLVALAQWLEEHQLECLHTVERWMLRSLIVPRAVASEVWADPDWRHALQNMVVAPADGRGRVDYAAAGLLREADAKRGLGIVDRDGESQWLKSAAFAVSHPILIPDLAELRELAADLGVQQTIDQLYRPVYQPTAKQKKLKAIDDFAGGVFEQLNFATSLCRRLGYPVRGGYATCRVWEGESPLEARYYIGDEYPEAETWTGELIFVDAEQRPVRIGEVGPVTFSEGMRMAAAIYAKRKVPKSEEENP